MPGHLYYIKYPPEFEEHPAQPGDTEQFNTNAFLLRIDKDCYDSASECRHRGQDLERQRTRTPGGACRRSGRRDRVRRMPASDDATHRGLHHRGPRRSRWYRMTADTCAANNRLPAHQRTGRLSDDTHTMLWLLYVHSILSSTSRTSVAIPDAPTPGHRTALARTLRCIKHRAALARTLRYINNKCIVAQNSHTMKNPTNTFTAAENRDRLRVSTTVLSGHTA